MAGRNLEICDFLLFFLMRSLGILNQSISPTINDISVIYVWSVSINSAWPRILLFLTGGINSIFSSSLSSLPAHSLSVY